MTRPCAVPDYLTMTYHSRLVKSYIENDAQFIESPINNDEQQRLIDTPLHCTVDLPGFDRKEEFTYTYIQNGYEALRCKKFRRIDGFHIRQGCKRYECIASEIA